MKVSEFRVKRMFAFIAALVTTYVVAVLFYTQLNLGNLVELGLVVTGADRFSAALHDLGAMAPLYLPLLAIDLLLGFLGAAFVLRWVPQIRTLGYLIGGFAAVFVMDSLMSSATTLHMLPVTRTTIGLMSQCLAGAAGGWVFATLTSGRIAAEAAPTSRDP
jgi:hypothetical protein